MIHLKHIVLLCIALLSQIGLSQELTAKAHAKFKAGEFDSARVYIDQAVLSTEQTNSQTWQLRGLIYRKMESAEHPDYREIAIESFVQARVTDKEGIHAEKINEYLYHTIIRYYNDAVLFLNAGELANSERSYLSYKEKYLLLIDSKKDFTEQDIEYYNALGTGYSTQLNRLSGKEYEISFNQAIITFGRVLAIDSMNYSANLNSAVLYYNRGAELIDNPDVNSTIEELIENIDKSNTLFIAALPMMLKAYSINPESPEVIEGLAGIYYSLNDNDNWMIFQTKLDTINLPGLLESHQKNPADKEILKQLVRIYSSTLKDEAQYLKFKTILDQLGG